ncbi:MAG: hypothetical protein AABX33_02170 [Nanoarchaeota archaeon]
MSKKTLAERVLRNFFRIKLNKASVKVPILRIRKNKPAVQKGREQIPVSSIVSLLIKNAVEKSKSEKKEKKIVEAEKGYAILKEEKDTRVGGYGAVSKGYESAPHFSYISYGKIFGYLGKLRTQNPYENMAEHLATLNKSAESQSFVLADGEAIDKIGRYEKYLKSPFIDTPTMALSLIPVAGLSSGEWEDIKMLMKLDPSAYTLKTKTS